MQEIPAEILYRHAYKQAADYFAGLIEEHRKGGQVAVLVKDMFHSLYFMPCNRNGYPDYHYFRSLELPSLAAFVTDEEALVKIDDLHAKEVEIRIEKPLLSANYNYWSEPPVVFMWEGRRMGTKYIPAEQLNVQELMKLARQTIARREGIIIDEVLRNKIYK